MLSVSGTREGEGRRWESGEEMGGGLLGEIPRASHAFFTLWSHSTFSSCCSHNGLLHYHQASGASFHHLKLVKNVRAEAGEMAHRLKVHAVLVEDPSLIPSFHKRQLTTTQNSNSKGLMPRSSPITCTSVQIPTQRHIYVIKLN